MDKISCDRRVAQRPPTRAALGARMASSRRPPAFGAAGWLAQHLGFEFIIDPQEEKRIRD